MRDYSGVSVNFPEANDPTFVPRVRSTLSTIDYFLRDLSRGQARIQLGQVPDGSGDPIGTGGTLGDLYWYRPGIAPAFTAFMQTGPGGSGIISSTADPTKGSIFFGAVGAFDERDSALGVGTTDPLATIHLRRPTTDSLTLRPDGDIAAGGGQGQDGGTSSLYAYLNDQSDSTYVTWGGSTAQFTLSNASDPIIHTGHVVRYKYRNTTLHASSISIQIQLLEGAGTVIAQGTNHADIAISTTWSEASFTLTEAEAAAITDYTNLRINVLNGGFGGVDGVSASEISLELPNGTTGGLARWDNASSTQLGQIDSLGRTGINTAGNALSSWLTVRASATGETILALQDQASLNRLRAIVTNTNLVDFTFYPSGGGGVAIQSIGSGGTSGRIGIGTATGSIGGSLHITAENGSAPAIVVQPFSATTGNAIQISTPGGGTTTFSVSANGLINATGYAGQAAITRFTLDGTVGNAATLSQKIILHASQSGDCFQVRDSTDATTRFGIGLSGGLTIRPGTAVPSLILQRSAAGATNIFNILDTNSNIRTAVATGGRLMVNTTSTTGWVNAGLFSTAASPVADMTQCAISTTITQTGIAGSTNTSGMWRLGGTLSGDGADDVGSHAWLRIAPTISDNAGNSYALHLAGTYSGSAALGPGYIASLRIDPTITADTASHFGIDSQPTFAFTGAATGFALQFMCLSTGAGNGITLYGASGTINHTGSGTVTDAQGVSAATIFGASAGNATNNYGLRYTSLTVGNAVTVTNHYGVSIGAINRSGTGAVTNAYGYRLDSGFTGATNNWSYYSEPDIPSYFRGKIGINDTTPDAMFDTVIDAAGTIGQIIEAAASPTANYWEVRSSGGSAMFATKPGTTAANVVAHLLSAQSTAPTIAAGASLGTGPTVAVVAGSTDTAGRVELTAGTPAGAAGVAATITFRSPYAAAPKAVLISSTRTGSPARLAFASTIGTNSFDISFDVAPVATVRYDFDYWVIE